MQLVIEGLEYQAMFLVVTGKNSVGTIKGIWKGKQEPIVGNAYHIELSIGNPKEVRDFCEAFVPSVYLENENVMFTGLCEGSDDEVYYLRFAIDWLEMLDIAAVTSREKEDYISFSADWHDIEIYPYDL